MTTYVTEARQSIVDVKCLLKKKDNFLPQDLELVRGVSLTVLELDVLSLSAEEVQHGRQQDRIFSADLTSQFSVTDKLLIS